MKRELAVPVLLTLFVVGLAVWLVGLNDVSCPYIYNDGPSVLQWLKSLFGR